LSSSCGGNKVRAKGGQTVGVKAMNYTKIWQSLSRIDTAKLALWAALLAVVFVAGMAALGAGNS